MPVLTTSLLSHECCKAHAAAKDEPQAAEDVRGIDRDRNIHGDHGILHPGVPSITRRILYIKDFTYFILFHCTSPDSFLFHNYTIQSHSQFNLNKIYLYSNI